MKFLLVSLVVIVAFASSGTDAQTNVDQPENLSCFLCDGSQPNCEDKFVNNGIEMVDCSTLEYDDDEENLSRSANSKKAYKNTMLRGIFKNEKKVRALNYFYNCIKVKWINADGSIGIERTCARLNPSIQNVCEFIKSESKDAELKSCHACTTDTCNSATSQSASLLIFAIGCIFAKFA